VKSQTKDLYWVAPAIIPNDQAPDLAIDQLADEELAFIRAKDGVVPTVDQIANAVIDSRLA
jgi:hypothetical protein